MMTDKETATDRDLAAKAKTDRGRPASSDANRRIGLTRQFADIGFFLFHH